MHITQGTFSYLPEFTDEEIGLQVTYAMENNWAIAVEFTDDPHPRNVYWDMWGLPMFDAGDASAVVNEVNEARKAYPNRYIRVSAYDPSYGRQTTAMAFMVNRPEEEPGYRLERTETKDRQIQYTLQPYASNDPKGARYGEGNGQAK